MEITDLVKENWEATFIQVVEIVYIRSARKNIMYENRRANIVADGEMWGWRWFGGHWDIWVLISE